MGTKPVLAIVGATGLVGGEMRLVVEQLKLPFSELRLLASKNSAGELYSVNGEEVEVQELTESSFEGVNIALFAIKSNLAAKYVPIAAESGAIAIDNSSYFRMEPGIPLVVPEVNPHEITKTTKIIANPNCSTIQLVPVLKAIHEAAGLKRVVVSTYQAVSGAGKDGVDELFEQTRGIYNQKSVEPQAFRHQIAFNCIPQIDVILEDGYSKEEQKIIRESRKILGLPELKITSTTVRVPVMNSHAESVNVETERELTPEKLVAILAKTAGIQVYPNHEDYPMQVDVSSSDEIHVGRIRRDESVTHGLNLWIVADNVRKGAALNAVQIAQLLVN